MEGVSILQLPLCSGYLGGECSPAFRVFPLSLSSMTYTRNWFTNLPSAVSFPSCLTSLLHAGASCDRLPAALSSPVLISGPAWRRTQPTPRNPESLGDLSRPHSLIRAEQPGPAASSLLPCTSLESWVLDMVVFPGAETPQAPGLCPADVRVLSYVFQEQPGFCHAQEFSRRSLVLVSGWHPESAITP